MMDPTALAGFADVLKLIGGTSPLVALLAWHLWTSRADFKDWAKAQAEAFDKLGAKLDALTQEVHELDTRTAVVEARIGIRRQLQPQDAA